MRKPKADPMPGPALGLILPREAPPWCGRGPGQDPYPGGHAPYGIPVVRTFRTAAEVPRRLSLSRCPAPKTQGSAGVVVRSGACVFRAGKAGHRPEGHPDHPPEGINFTSVESGWPGPALSCARPASPCRRTHPFPAVLSPSSKPWSRTMPTACSTRRAASVGARSRVICPASTLARSRMSLIRDSRCLPESSDVVLEVLFLTSSEDRPIFHYTRAAR
ncbi:MAG: hypothetical protein MZV64_09165 [Ignavibacteriales bacterium]|nr:hypothetical protein [Ignavibacteriales bacterium]